VTARLLALAALVLAFALATAFAPWWAVPLVAAIWGATVARPGAAREAGLAAALAWGLLLARDATGGPAGAVAARVGAVMGLPGGALVAVSLLYPWLLAWAAATVAGWRFARGAVATRRRARGTTRAA
jgi:hypothetical protein